MLIAWQQHHQYIKQKRQDATARDQGKYEICERLLSIMPGLKELTVSN